MPELPEVETIRRDLVPRLVGARILSVWTSGKPLHGRRQVDLAGLRRVCAGRRIVALRRHGKFLFIDTERGTVVVHLGMTGRLTVATGVAPPHTHVVWTLDSGRELRFVDARRFGQVTLRLPAGVGIDPFDRAFSADRVGELLGRSRRGVKLFLLDQSRIAGIGNIYASEALFLARVHPDARADRLGPERVKALFAAVREVLRASIRNRGTTLRDYADGEGRAGRNQRRLHVYGRAGEPCSRCGAAIRRAVHQNRSTFFCPRCQIR